MQRQRNRTIMSAAAAGGSARVPVGSLLLLVGGVLAVVAALLGRSGFTVVAACSKRGERRWGFVAHSNLCGVRLSVVGIDLGTTYSVVAISQRNNVSVISDAQGHALVPSTVAFLPGGGAAPMRSVWIVAFEHHTSPNYMVDDYGYYLMHG